MRRTIASILLALYVAFLLSITLLILPADHPSPNLVPFRSILHDLRAGGRDLAVNFAGNLAAFVPIGVLIPLARPRPTSARLVAGLGFGLSALIEISQFASGRRVGDVDDLILNTLGTLLGLGLLRAASHPARTTADG